MPIITWFIVFKYNWTFAQADDFSSSLITIIFIRSELIILWEMFASEKSNPILCRLSIDRWHTLFARSSKIENLKYNYVIRKIDVRSERDSRTNRQVVAIECSQRQTPDYGSIRIMTDNMSEYGCVCDNRKSSAFRCAAVFNSLNCHLGS